MVRMRAWYDIKSLDFKSRADLGGVQESSAQEVIALHLASRFSQKLAGVLALSTYMCEPDLLAKDAIDINRDTPIMMAHGEQDEVVPVFMGNAAYNALKENNFNAIWQTYTMQHNVCMQELTDIGVWLKKVLD